MSGSTIVAVHAYAGDRGQVEAFMPYYEHHEAPIIVLSPEDSRVVVPKHICVWGGRRAYEGLTSVRRQIAHLRILLELSDADHYLLHDSDSVCLSPEIPDYLYAEPDTVFYNGCPTDDYFARLGVSWSLSEVFQPPLFMSRNSIEKLLEVADETVAALPPFGQLIDWWFAVATQRAGLISRSFPDGLSRPIWNLHDVARVYAQVRCRGVRVLHSIKKAEVMEAMVGAYRDWVADPEGSDLCARW